MIYLTIHIVKSIFKLIIFFTAIQISLFFYINFHIGINNVFLHNWQFISIMLISIIIHNVLNDVQYFEYTENEND